ncbi:MAG: NAD-dependent epimerase/dehydratase family protein [Actinomycetota bacterium]
MTEAGAAPLTVAVTGPTGDIGRALLRALDASPRIERVVGMARRPFDPSQMGLGPKVRYRRGDITDPDAVESLAAEANVVVHLAFLIFGSKEETSRINLEGSRNVFLAALNAGCERLVYTSSVAAYGFHDDNPKMLGEDVPVRGSSDHYYSEQKASVERLLEDLSEGSSTDVYVFRPCIVAGPSALALIEKIPYVQLSEKLPDGVRSVVGKLPGLRPVIPDPGVPFQLVHEDDVASALVAAVEGEGEPGAYNLAAEGRVGLDDLAHALGWYCVPVPELALDATIKIASRLPYLPSGVAWINAVQVPVLVDTTKARTKLDWEPRYDALETLAQTVQGAREAGLLRRRSR